MISEQVGHEFAASQQYVAIAVYYDAETLPLLAAHFYRQALEERNHAMMLVQYLLDSDHDDRDPGGRGAADLVRRCDRSGRARAGAGEARHRSDQRADGLAREENDLVGEQFMHWFLQEQREEVSSMSDLLSVVRRAGDNLLLVEDFLSRNQVGDAGAVDVSAPPAAGGSL